MTDGLVVWLRAQIGWLRPHQSGAWFITTPLGEMGPFSTAEEASEYPHTFRGWIDAPLFRRGYEIERRP